MTTKDRQSPRRLADEIRMDGMDAVLTSTVSASAIHPPGEAADASRHLSSALETAGAGLQGKRVAMITFSPYPSDPRPRRAADALLKEGMSVDFFCVGDKDALRREFLNGINIRRLPITNRRGGKMAYAYQYSSFIFLASVIMGLRSLRRRLPRSASYP